MATFPGLRPGAPCFRPASCASGDPGRDQAKEVPCDPPGRKYRPGSRPRQATRSASVVGAPASRPRLGSTGGCSDNSMAESFIASFEC
jgi:hypothetical protein